MGALDRKALLPKIASEYVIEGLEGKDFNAIPYSEKVELRAR
ncbi:MAG: hypothetical protein AAFX53_02740 [Bacteroidota bacterium]